MGEIHNLQIVISQASILNHLNEGKNNGAANGAQILNLVEEKRSLKNSKMVREIDELEKTEKEESRKRRIKKAADDKLLDLYG